MWLLERLFNKGDQPEPHFAFQSTVNWMRALAILCEDEGFSTKELKALYITATYPGAIEKRSTRMGHPGSINGTGRV
jgi:hypothetical protein